MTDTKICTGCGVDKPLEEYPTDSGIKSGRKAKCRVCAAVIKKDWRKRTLEENPNYDKDRYWTNPEKRIEASKRWIDKKLEENPDYYKEYYAENSETLKENQQRYLEKNRELAVKRTQDWYWNKGGKDKEKIRRFLYGYNGKSSTGKPRPFRGYLKTQGICLFCGELHPLMLENAHIFPDNHDDLISLCYNCHKKLDKYPMLLPDEFQYQK